MTSIIDLDKFDPAGERQQALSVLSSLQAWGYQEVQLPTWLEWERIAGPLATLGTESCKFIAPDQRVLVLLPDPTLGVLAQGVHAHQPAAGAVPRQGFATQRVCYWANAFRVSRSQGWARIPQVGAELLGPSSPAADSEVVTVAVDAVTSAGHEDCRVFMNDVTLTGALCDLLGPGAAAEAREALAQGDFVTLQQLTADDELLGRALRYAGSASGLRSLLSELAQFHGDARDTTGLILNRARYLEQVSSLVQAAGYPVEVLVDTSMVREIGYYDGFVFQIIARGSGRLLAGGGRYDSLLASMGVRGGGGAGFACNLAQLADLTGDSHTITPDHVLAVSGDGDLTQVWREAGRLRRSGQSVSLQHTALDAAGGEETEQ